MSSPVLPVVGALLAGGRSRRFGSPKALARLDGVRLIDRALSTLRSAGLRPHLVLREHDALGASLGVPVILDVRPGSGPLSAVVAALRTATARGLSGVVPIGVDQPLVPAALLRHIAELGLTEDVRAVAVEGVKGLEPLSAFYGARALPVAESRLRSGAGDLRGLLDALPTRRISRDELQLFGDPQALFLNVNTPADLDRAAEVLSGAPPADPPGPGAGPAIYCVVGWKNAGKTGFVVELVRELARRGHRVMTVKHGHGFSLDRPGSDTYRHRHEGGALRVAAVGPDGGGILGTWPGGEEPDLDEVVSRYLSDADFVIAEGFKGSHHPKVAIESPDGPSPPISSPAAGLRGPVLAVVSDVLPKDGGGAAPHVPRGQDAARAVADRIEAHRDRGSGDSPG